MENKKRSMRKALYIALAVLVAASIWFFVDVTGNNGNPITVEKRFTDIPIEYTGETLLGERGLMLVEEGTETTVDLKLQGTRWNIAKLDRSQIVVIVNLSAVDSPGQQNLPVTITYTDRSFASRLTTKDGPFSIAVNISELSSKQVDVRCELVGNVAEGYSGSEPELSHTTVEVRGQSEDIAPVAYAKIRLDIGKDAKGTVSQTLDYEFYDANDHLIENNNIHKTVEQIQATMRVTVTKELRLVVDFQEFPGARVQNLSREIRPETITVSGDADQLRDVETIQVGEMSLLDLMQSGGGVYYFPITVPPGCENLSGVTRATLTASFKDMASGQVTTDRIRYENLPAGKKIDILTLEMAVNIFGTAADVEAATGDDVSVVADLSSYNNASGSYTVPARVEIASGKDIGVTGTYKVQVTIRDLDAEPEPDVPPEPTDGQDQPLQDPTPDAQAPTGD